MSATVVRLAAAIMMLPVLAPQARVFLTGSNPVLSSIAFPQDIFLIPGGDVISSYTSWQGFPWWGDIDETENRPYKKYVPLTQKNEEQAYKASINLFEERIGLIRRFSERLKADFDLLYSVQHCRADAAGYLRDGGQRYTYLEKHAIREVYLKSVLASYYKTLPIGFSAGLGIVSTSKPDLDASSPRLLWGWDGESYLEQDEYAIGSLFKSDLQAGVSFGLHKIGTRFRLYAGSLDHYRWNGEENRYTVTPRKIHNYTFRLYGIYNWFKRDKFRFNTTVLTRYTFVDSITMVRNRPGTIETVEKAKTFVFQINPNINVYPWKFPMTFIDAAILCNYEHMRYDFRNPDESYRQTDWWGTLEDYSWESFSYGRENFVEAALDIYASIPVFGMKDRMAAVGISTLLWRRYKWFNKYFYSDGDVRNIRKNFDKETWLNTVVNLIYRRGGVMYRLDIAQPLIYSLTPRTTICDGNGDPTGNELRYEKMWLSQSSFKIGFFISTDLQRFIRYQPFSRPDGRLSDDPSGS